MRDLKSWSRSGGGKTKETMRCTTRRGLACGSLNHHQPPVGQKKGTVGAQGRTETRTLLTGSRKCDAWWRQGCQVQRRPNNAAPSGKHNPTQRWECELCMPCAQRRSDSKRLYPLIQCCQQARSIGSESICRRSKVYASWPTMPSPAPGSGTRVASRANQGLEADAGLRTLARMRVSRGRACVHAWLGGLNSRQQASNVAMLTVRRSLSVQHAACSCQARPALELWPTRTPPPWTLSVHRDMSKRAAPCPQSRFEAAIGCRMLASVRSTP